MILSARKCGCPVHGQLQKSQLSSSDSSSTNLNSCSSLSSSETDLNARSCGCASESSCEEEPKPLVVSEIATTGKPYKELEIIINNNRMVMRLQKEYPEDEFDPPCDCIEPNPPISQKQTACPPPQQPVKFSSNITFQKAPEGCKTITVYPNPDPATATKTPEGSTGGSSKKRHEIKKLPPVNPEENPNIFVLKIKRKCENEDRAHNLDLEFRTPRPWSKETYCKYEAEIKKKMKPYCLEGN